jgi:uncharacterized Zn-binding protein involved in type VI secretion
MPKIVRVGDRTAKNRCTVISSSAPHFIVNGMAAALVGDRLSCRCVIVEGDPQHTVHGVAVAFDGCKTSCGDVLRTSATTYEKIADRVAG